MNEFKALATIGLEQLILILFKESSDNKVRASLQVISDILNKRGGSTTKEQIRHAVDNLINDNKITRFEDGLGSYISVINDIEASSKLHDIKPKLFKKELKEKHFAVIKVLKRHCVGEVNAHKAEFLMFQAKFICNVTISTDSELRKIIGEIIDCDTELRIIGSNPQKGYWLALAHEGIEPNQYRNSRVYTEMLRSIKNGTPITYIYAMLNDIKGITYPVDKQTTHKFNSEKTIVNRYSDDLL